jgi:hypothetical protein
VRELFSQPWPEDLPPVCPHCRGELRVSRNLDVGPGRLGRLFRGCAYWGMLPWVFLSWLLLGLGVVGEFNMSGPGGLAMVGYFLLPVEIFLPIALFMPNSRRVRCWKCGYDRDFPALPPKRRGRDGVSGG